jgi:ribosomal protein S18 acetylase RimI-like enzyme
MSAILVPMSIEDYPGMIALWQSLEGIGLSGADEQENLAGFIKQNAGACFVLKEDNRVVGTILTGNDGRRGYIYHLAIKPKYQKQGYGRKLVEKALDALKTAGIQKSHIFVISDNQAGIDFWEHIGWTLRDDVLIMSKDLI